MSSQQIVEDTVVVLDSISNQLPSHLNQPVISSCSYELIAIEVGGPADIGAKFEHLYPFSKGVFLIQPVKHHTFHKVVVH